MAKQRWNDSHSEEDYLESRRKDFRKERKLLVSKDRSKFKKTDLGKFEHARKEEYRDRRSQKKIQRGRVLSVTSKGVIVESEGITYTCSLRGLLKKQKTQYKNLVTVGDFVHFEALPGNEGMIADVEKRQSILSRADNLSRRKEQLIAANIDQVLITSSVVSPPLKPSLIDRYIIAAEKGLMAPVIVINKVDLLEDASVDADVRDQQRALLEECKTAYGAAGVPLLVLSAETGEGMQQLKEVMKDKASVFSGQSGTGKSSLINAVTGLGLTVRETVKKTKKGAHTTTAAHLVPLAFGGWCVDTPGIKSFGLWDLQADEVESYFSEIHEVAHNCKFPNCTHNIEEKCAVREAVENGAIHPLRYESYQTLMETTSAEHKRR